MSWNGFGSSYSNGQLGGYYQNQIPTHYANAYHYRQQGATMMPQPTQITVPSPGFSSHQPMASLVPMHMRNRTGPVRCGHEGCLFAGTHKEVEVHKMDRHLIFPPGWQEKGKGKGKRKREGEDNDYVDEEAQFRISGAASILGTDAKLDSPEAIAAWLEERKKRWPSAKRITEKAQHRREALERGQILAEPSRLHPSGADSNNVRVIQSHRGRGRGRGKPVNHARIEASRANREDQHPLNVRGRISHARGRGVRGSRITGGRWQERGQDKPLGTGALPNNPNSNKDETNTTSITDSSTSTESSPESGSDTTSDDDSGPDMDPMKDAISSKAKPPRDADTEVPPPSNQVALPPQHSEEVPLANTGFKKQTTRRGAPQPPKPAYNPFDHRPNLLRNLLMPDIRATVSNLSQAIKFLVANDFLENVELKPGDAENVPIQSMDVDTPATAT
ncbi:unnamed protein product [Rhizoctonia solani]|uniref:FMR1-interacting protein 1 conserved domain-containing protein n=3 Tax=Rhizoctonia solani TaxID=456999 RepID=A0A8H2X470_9AGAM|nr:nuclear fragile X mental retardation-interacting protein [Rhizoctonia solani AG-3 Rhs1AP]KEP53172.1 nuclear fragile X mental retardation-interacting protein [Rhizoctonia solani 123E]CAE6416716.1 unnamed protein product [Rhizoctonia solani]CAE6463073.1 unnamed protein product [Rhizoctonia solani]